MVKRQGSLFLGVLLLGIGSIYLLKALDIWEDDLSVWPGVLIALGVAIALDEWSKDRRVSWFAPVVLIAIGAYSLLRNLDVVESEFLVPAALIGAGVLLLAGAFRKRNTVTDVIDVPRDGAARSRVRIEHGGGEMRVGSLPTGSANLVYGTAGGVEVTSRRSSDVIDLTLSQTRGAWARSIGKQFRIDFNPDVELELDLRTGATDTRLDLTNLRVTSLQVKTGASSTVVDAPQSGHLTASVDAGAASVEVRIPPNVAARIASDTGLADVSIDTNRFPSTGAGYESPDYAVAVDRIDLRIKGGVASFTVR